MLTNQDIKKLSKIFATKDEVVNKVEFQEFKDEVVTKADFQEGLSILYNSIDKILKKMDTFHSELISLGQKVDRHDVGIEEVSPKVGVKLK